MIHIFMIFRFLKFFIIINKNYIFDLKNNFNQQNSIKDKIMFT